MPGTTRSGRGQGDFGISRPRTWCNANGFCLLVCHCVSGPPARRSGKYVSMVLFPSRQHTSSAVSTQNVFLGDLGNFTNP